MARRIAAQIIIVRKKNMCFVAAQRSTELAQPHLFAQSLRGKMIICVHAFGRSRYCTYKCMLHGCQATNASSGM